uniref:Uncharacterized protein n=1 Tax=Romanomermis culicivorax TaxID=13658 RepID=A0A915HL05_ROMCU
MNYLKNSLQSMVGNRNEGDYSSSAETVERLVERLETSTTFEDRRDALRALRSLSKSYRLDVGAQSSQILLNLLKNDPNAILSSGVDLTNLILETLNNIVSGDSEGVAVGISTSTY